MICLCCGREFQGKGNEKYCESCRHRILDKYTKWRRLKTRKKLKKCIACGRHWTTTHHRMCAAVNVKPLSRIFGIQKRSGCHGRRVSSGRKRCAMGMRVKSQCPGANSRSRYRHWDSILLRRNFTTWTIRRG